MLRLSDPLDRVMTRVAMGQDGCILSTYSLGSHGYPQAYGNGTVTLAHLIIWRHHNGPVPVGFTVDHKCKTKRCIRLSHLRLLSNLDNARRTSGRDWPLGECVNGHSDQFWKPKGPERQKGYCPLCRAEARRRQK